MKLVWHFFLDLWLHPWVLPFLAGLSSGLLLALGLVKYLPPKTSVVSWNVPALERQEINQEFIFGFPDNKKGDSIFDNFQIQMSSLLGKSVKAVVGSSFADLQQGLQEGSFQGAFLSAVIFSRIQNQNLQLIPLVQFTRGNNPQHSHVYEGSLIALKSSKFQKFSQICESTIGFTDLDSSSGYVYPKWVILENLYKTQNKNCKFKEVLLGSHRHVVEALESGQIDFGAVFSNPGTFEGAWTKYGKKEIQIIMRTPFIPTDGFFISSKIPLEERNMIKSSLFKYFQSKEGKAFIKNFFGADSVVYAKEEDYKNVLAVSKRLQVLLDWYQP